MANGNPYSITPAGDLSQGLMGFGQMFMQGQKMKAGREEALREEEKIKALKEGAMRAYQSGDPDAMYQFGVENPGYASAMNAGAGRQAEKDNKDLAQEIMESLIETPDMGEQEKKTLEMNLALTDPKTYEAYTKVSGKAGGVNQYSPSPLKKMIDERQALLDEGFSPDSPEMKAYDNRITGVDIDIENMTDDEIDTWGAIVALTGKMPSLGRGKQSTKIRQKIAKSAARYGLDAKGAAGEKRTPAEAALEIIGSQADTKAIQGAVQFLEKQLSSMGSFVENLNAQVDRVTELSKELKTSNIRILNVPLRLLRSKIIGSPNQAKYDLFISEIERESAKLASGATQSVGMMSDSEIAAWNKIHDKNLSIPDMLDVLQETKLAANFRRQSVQQQLNKTRRKMRTRDFGETKTYPKPTQGALDRLKSNPQMINDFEEMFGYKPEGY